MSTNFGPGKYRSVLKVRLFRFLGSLRHMDALVMTSGQFTSVPLNKIWVDRAARQRRELNGIDGLADSIRRLGLIHPIVITRDFELKAGERRLEACKALGWTNISAQWFDDLDPTQLLLLELEENVKRENISWQEQCEAVHSYHQIRLAQDPDWNATKTADALGETKQSISAKLMVHAEGRSNKFISEAPKLSTAINITRRNLERRREATLNQIANKPQAEVPLQHIDFFDWLKAPPDIHFNFLHCDFPYGVNFGDWDRQSSVKMDHAYEDTFDNYIKLCSALTEIPLSSSCHLVFWFSMEHYSWTYDFLTGSGWKVNRFPLIWSKGNAGILPDAQRGPRRVYETAFMASKGDRKIVHSVNNHFSFWDSERIHQSEKPRAVLEYFFRMFVDEYTVMLDPTAGSGNAVRVTDRMGAKFVLGLEKEGELYEKAKEAYFKD